MNTESYLEQIALLIRNLPPKDQERSLAFYAESIADRMEDGMTEEEAVASMDPPEVAARAILMGAPLPSLVKARVKEKRMGAFEILLLVLGAPLWLPLLLTLLVLELSLYIVVWSLVISLAAVALALALSSLAVLVAAVYSIVKGGVPMMLLCLGAALILAGLAALFFLLVRLSGKLSVDLGKAMLRGIKSLLIHKEEIT